MIAAESKTRKNTGQENDAASFAFPTEYIHDHWREREKSVHGDDITDDNDNY